MAFIKVEKKIGRRPQQNSIRVSYNNYTIKGRDVTFRIFSFPPEILLKWGVIPNDYIDIYVDNSDPEKFFFKKSLDDSGYRLSNRKYNNTGRQYISMMIPKSPSRSFYVHHEFKDKGLFIDENNVSNKKEKLKG